MFASIPRVNIDQFRFLQFLYSACKSSHQEIKLDMWVSLPLLRLLRI